MTNEQRISRGYTVAVVIEAPDGQVIEGHVRNSVFHDEEGEGIDGLYIVIEDGKPVAVQGWNCSIERV